MKIICPKCGIIHDEDFAPCKTTLSLPAADEASRHITVDTNAPTLIEEAPQFVARMRAAAAAAGAGGMGLSVVEPERAAAAVALPERSAPERPAPEWPAIDGPAAQPEWRREVAERLESYRARRRKYRPLDVREAPDDSQPLLALGPENAVEPRSETALVEETGDAITAPDFDEGNNGDAPESGNGLAVETGRGLPVVQFAVPDLVADPEEYTRHRAALRIAARPRHPDRVEITVAQPQFDFSVNETQDLRPQDEQRPVADLRERRLAGLVDAAILGVACAGFFLLFAALGGEISFTRFGVAACLASAFLVYAQYFVLFTVFIGVTPGMMLRGLEVRALDGSAPTARHLLWRSFGYLLSCAAVFLGFLWALWDDDRLTWQDRISQTYLTPATEGTVDELVSSLQQS